MFISGEDGSYGYITYKNNFTDKGLKVRVFLDGKELNP